MRKHAILLGAVLLGVALLAWLFWPQRIHPQAKQLVQQAAVVQQRAQEAMKASQAAVQASRVTEAALAARTPRLTILAKAAMQAEEVKPLPVPQTHELGDLALQQQADTAKMQDQFHQALHLKDLALTQDQEALLLKDQALRELESQARVPKLTPTKAVALAVAGAVVAIYAEHKLR